MKKNSQKTHNILTVSEPQLVRNDYQKPPVSESGLGVHLCGLLGVIYRQTWALGCCGQPESQEFYDEKKLWELQ